MKKILFIGSLVMASLLYAQGSQPVEITQQDINTQNEMSDASTKDITLKSIEDFFEEFADNFGIEHGITKDEKTFYTGKSTVAVNDTDPQFAQALQNAYQKQC
nr:putative periplasmic protein [Campylobacter jejuni]